MPKITGVHSSDLRGFSQLTMEALSGLTHLMEALHHNIARAPGHPDRPVAGSMPGISGPFYRHLRRLIAQLGDRLDAMLEQSMSPVAEPWVSPGREALLAALNGVLGDYLVETRNPLAIPMRLRYKGQPLILETPALAEAIPQPAGKLLVLVHGLCMNDLQWARSEARAQRSGQNARAGEGGCRYSRLARKLGFVPVYLRYNSGRHISTNGREFAELMAALIARWPVPVQELVIISISMGGLVTRSACHYGALADHAWLRRLDKLVFLGTPHHGSPLERGGNWIDNALSASSLTAPFALLGKIRSAGITDLRYGNLLDEDWQGVDRFERCGDRRRAVPLPEKVSCYAIAATAGKQPGDIGDRLLGDGLVPVHSALGQHHEPHLNLTFPASRQWVGYGMHHLGLLSQPSVYQQVKHWLASRS